MSVAVSHSRHASQEPGHPSRRRVRQDARDALAVAAFSAGASTGLAVLATVVLARLG